MNWDEVEPSVRAKAYRAIDSDPQVLFETDGGPVDIDADLIYARLIGFEDEIVQDGVRLSEAVPVIRVPVPRALRLSDFASDDPVLAPEPIRVAEYRLQSGFATLAVDAMYEPPVESARKDGTIRVAYLRYRRRT